MDQDQEEDILKLDIKRGDLMHKVEHVMLLDVIRNQKVIMDALQSIMYHNRDQDIASSLEDRMKKCNTRYPDV